MIYLDSLIAIINEYKLISSIVLVFIVIFIRDAILRKLKRRAKKKGKDSRSSIAAARNITNFLIFLAVLFSWENEIQGLALSIAAFMVAIVLATREYIQCLLGFIYISSTRSFAVGDWVQVNNINGEVTNKDWLKVTLLEVDMHNYSYTGKSLTIPNNQFVTHAVKNMNFLKRYVTHTFSISVEPKLNICQFTEQVLTNANHYCEDFHEVAVRYNNLIEKRLDVSLFGPEAHVHVSTNDIGNNILTITIFCPTEQAIHIEQKITHDFLTDWYAELYKLPPNR